MRVLIADDHDLIRKSLSLLFLQLRADADIHEASTLSEAQALNAKTQFDVVLLDPGLPDLADLADAQALAESANGAILVIVSGANRPEDVRTAMRLGARGYLSKSDPSAVTRKALDLVLEGGTSFPPLADQDGEGAFEPVEPLPDLTPRQSELLRLIADGHANAEIAYRLSISEGTVRVHVSNLLKRLGVTSRTQAALKARNALKHN
ncbi:MAG: response regulator transcription factor [Pseudomonadota bacterium]